MDVLKAFDNGAQSKGWLARFLTMMAFSIIMVLYLGFRKDYSDP